MHEQNILLVGRYQATHGATTRGIGGGWPHQKSLIRLSRWLISSERGPYLALLLEEEQLGPLSAISCRQDYYESRPLSLARTVKGARKKLRYQMLGCVAILILQQFVPALSAGSGTEV